MANPNKPATECKTCGVSLLVEGKKKLKGATCMQCHGKEQVERRRRKRNAAIELLGNKCADCNQVFPEVCYDFHHTDPSKKDDAVANLIHNNRKLETILNEASKCELLCANCHRLRHFS